MQKIPNTLLYPKILTSFVRPYSCNYVFFQNLEKKKLQMKDTEHDLASNITSADQRLISLLNLLPDLEETSNEFLRSDTEVTSDIDSHCGSRLGTPLGGTRPSSSILANHTYRKIANIMGNHDIHRDQGDSQSEVTVETEDVHEERRNETTTGELIVKGQSKETDRTDNKKAKVEQTKPRNVYPTQPKTTALQRDRMQSQRKVARPPDTYNKPDVDRWLAQQQNNEHIQNLHKKVASFKVGEMENRSTDAEDNGKMETIQESAREVKVPSKSGHTLVTRTVSLKDSSKEHWQVNHNTSQGSHERDYGETKTSSASSGNNSSQSSVPGCIQSEETTSKGQISRSIRRGEATSSRDRFVSTSSDKFILDTGECHLTSRKRRQSKPFPDQNANVIIESETQDLATPLSRGMMRKEKESDHRAKNTLQSSRELLQTKRIDLSLPNA